MADKKEKLNPLKLHNKKDTWFFVGAIILLIVLLWFIVNNIAFITGSLNKAFDFNIDSGATTTVEFDIEGYESLNIPE